MEPVVYETIESLNEYVEKVVKGSRVIADYLRQDQTQIALQTILQFSDGMSWLVDASNLLKQHGIEIEFNIEQVHEFLNEINHGLEIQDYVLVADMFEYEIAPFFEKIPIVRGLEH